MASLGCHMIVLGAFTDFERFMNGYQVAVEPLIKQFGGEYLLVGGGGAVVSRWPDRNAALAFWNSSEYAELKKLREGTGQFQVLLVDAYA